VTDSETLPIVDTHHHVWDLDRFNLPWLKGAPKLDRSFLMSDYLEATAGLNVVKSVYMEVDVEPSQQAAEADHVLDLCEQPDNPMVAAVIAGRPASPEFGDHIARFHQDPRIKGVRQVLHWDGAPPGFCLQDAFFRGVRLLGELGLSFDLCMRSSELLDGARLADHCPETRFILDHCGNPDVKSPDLSQWRRDLVTLAERPNVICKVSGIVASARPGQWTPADLEPVVRHVLETFGMDRVVFGGDWPVCTLAATYRQWVEALRWIVRDLPIEDQRRLFHDNAVAFYGLD
jgi:L-fuconolactonase